MALTPTRELRGKAYSNSPTACQRPPESGGVTYVPLGSARQVVYSPDPMAGLPVRV